MPGRWQYLYHEIIEPEQKIRSPVEVRAGARCRWWPKCRASDLDTRESWPASCAFFQLVFAAGSQIYTVRTAARIATLKPRHVRVKGDVVEFNFQGKRRIPQHRELKDRQVTKVVRQLLKYPAAEVFKFRNEDGQFVDVKRRHINQHIKQVMGESFSAKDFRTWAGTLICACALANSAEDCRKARGQTKDRASNQRDGRRPGNTPAGRSYIYPHILES
jgi:DNA topoisomerase-1